MIFNVTLIIFIQYFVNRIYYIFFILEIALNTSFFSFSFLNGYFKTHVFWC